MLGRHFDVDAEHVYAYVLGEHGDSEVLTWSQATIAGMCLDDFVKVHGTPLTPEDVRQIDEPEFAGITFALPHLVSGSGPLATIAPPLDEAERTSLERSASVLRDAIGSLHLAG